MENDNLDRSMKLHLGGEAPPEAHAQASLHFRDLASSLREHACSAKPRHRSGFWLWAGISAVGALSIIVAFVALFVSPAPTWADVAERFRNVRFFNATVFFTSNVGQPPEKIDLWVAQDHRLRAHYRGLIFFGSEGKIRKVLSAVNGQEIPVSDLQAYLRFSEGAGDPYPALALVGGIARLGEMREFSLDNLLQLLCSKREQLQSTLNTEETLRSDMQVFDFSAKNRSEWMRLWVLHKSELPVRLRMWDACDSTQTDLVFDYATQMPADAFDAALVRKELLSKQGTANRLYTLLNDSGGRPLSPEQLFAVHGYHLPEIDSVGRTPEGVVWVLSRDVENRRPDGESVYGWTSLTDDLGGTYTRRIAGWLEDEGVLLEYYVPANLGENTKQPGSLQLSCIDTPQSSILSNSTGKTIGVVTLNHWRETKNIPDLLIAQNNQINGRTNWDLAEMDVAAGQQDWKRFETVAAAIKGSADRDPVALQRDIKIAYKLVLNQEADSAKDFIKRLYPIVSAAGIYNYSSYTQIARWHVMQLIVERNLTEARMIANKHAQESIPKHRLEGSQFVTALLEDLHVAGISEAEIINFFSREVLTALRDAQPKFAGTSPSKATF
ncbi:MAG: hypothetical protein QM790_01045 [Nibricoccus sp.]